MAYFDNRLSSDSAIHTGIPPNVFPVVELEGMSRVVCIKMAEHVESFCRFTRVDSGLLNEYSGVSIFEHV